MIYQKSEQKPIQSPCPLKKGDKILLLLQANISFPAIASTMGFYFQHSKFTISQHSIKQLILF